MEAPSPGPSAYREDLGEVELGEEEALGLPQGVGLEATQRSLQVSHGGGVHPAHTQVTAQQAGVAHQAAQGDAQRSYGYLQSTGGCLTHSLTPRPLHSL